MFRPRHLLLLIMAINLTLIATGQAPGGKGINPAYVETQLNQSLDAHLKQDKGIICFVTCDYAWGDDAGEFSYLVKSLGDRILKARVNEEGTVVEAANGDYYFELLIPGDGSGTSLKRLHFQEDKQYVDQCRKNLGIEVNPLTCGFGIKKFAIQDAISEGLVRIDSAERLGTEPTSDIKLSLSRTDKTPSQFWYFKSGYVIVSPKKGWRITRQKLALMNGHRDKGRGVTTRTFDLVGPHRTLGLTHYEWEEHWTQPGVEEPMSLLYRYKFNYLDEVPELEDFTLAAFGLDPPVRK